MPEDGLPDIDRLVHEPARFAILAHLSVVESAEFLFIQNQLGLTKGNLSSHMAKLEAAGYVKVVKEFVGKRPHTMLMLTKNGRRALDDYRKKMKGFLDGKW